MTYSELMAMVYVASNIGTLEAKATVRTHIYASETVKSITREQRAKLINMLNK